MERNRHCWTNHQGCHFASLPDTHVLSNQYVLFLLHLLIIMELELCEGTDKRLYIFPFHLLNRILNTFLRLLHKLFLVLHFKLIFRLFAIPLEGRTNGVPAFLQRESCVVYGVDIKTL